ncbi:hypothetical protein N7526_008068 [Penicillium atrosanguineum]|nr:hypothetical protein N7526_008068 [Penicillium atrosanguineum]
MPNSTSSPVKRPGLGRRAVSSHAVVTRANSNLDLSESHNSKAPIHKAHRTHVVGGGRNHHRNPSVGKNFNKLQRFQLGPEPTGRHHQRKKSAPATPVASPKGTAHVRWDTGTVDDHPKNDSMKRNNSTPILQRNNSGVGKKTLVTDRPALSSGKKKSVGFELGDDETDEAEWEDTTTQSPESMRRNSVVPSNHSAENPAVLVDPLTFVKRPYPQMPRATSLPDSVINKFVRRDPEEDEDEDEDEDEENDSDVTPEQEQPGEQGDIASRLLSPSHSAKAPPAMSSISAMGEHKPAISNSATRSASFKLAAVPNAARRTFSTSNLGLASMPGSQPQATSSSMEGGVSRFIVNNKAGQASSRTDSDPNTPSSFLPHYHPQTPPSPGRGAGKSTASPARPRGGADLPSRTQQKLWLQRTATLNNSPPDTHGVSTAASPSAMDSGYMPTGHKRSASGVFDANRGMNGASRASGSGFDSETRHIRKAYEKMSLELMVVRRFQTPTGDSFTRLRSIARASKAVAARAEHSSMGKPVKSAPSLTLLQHQRRPSRIGSSSELPDPHSSTSEDPATRSESTDTQATKSAHPSARILSTSDEAAHGLQGDNDPEDYPAVNGVDMMIRRMWESREVASSN